MFSVITVDLVYTIEFPCRCPFKLENVWLGILNMYSIQQNEDAYVNAVTMFSIFDIPVLYDSPVPLHTG